jgi:hypothetical protein
MDELSPGAPAAHRAAGDVALTQQFDNHDGYRPEATEALAGTELTLVPAGSAATLTVAFGAGSVSWEAAGSSGSAPCEVLAVGDEVFAVAARLGERESVFAIIDRGRQRVLSIRTRLEDGADGVEERTAYAQAGIGAPPAQPFEPTTDLVGKRILWRYSSTHAFEHIYLNPTNYCWHGVEGPERWIGDVDPCRYFDLGDGRYLMSWSETAVPYNGAVVLDLGAMLSVGRFFGWDTEREEAGQIVVGARGTLLNETSHQGL